MDKLFYFIAALGLVTLIWGCVDVESPSESIQYKKTDLVCSESFFSYARNSSDQVYFPVLKSVISHTYN